MVNVTRIPDKRAYSVYCNGRELGMVRFRCPIPFRQVVEFA